MLLAAMLTTMLVLPPLISAGRSSSLIAVPDARRVHQGAPPQVGGLAIFCGFALPLVLFGVLQDGLLVYLIAAICVLAMGLLDDFKDLTPLTKLLIQFLAAIAVLLFPQVYTVPGFSVADTPWFATLWWLLAVFGLIGVTNAVNLSDGLDGLAAGLVMLSASSLAVLAYRQELLPALALLIPLLGGLFGFLRYNTHPARVFMGDHGAYFIGFTLGYAALLLVAAGFSPFALLLLLGVPVYDTLSVAIRRLARGRSPFSADRGHLHHRLLDIGLAHDGAVLGVYLIHSAFVALGFALIGQVNELILGLHLFAVALLELGLRHGRRLVTVRERLRWWQLVRQQGSELVPRIGSALLVIGPIVATLLAPAPTLDFAVIAAVFLAALAAQSRLRGSVEEWSWLDRAMLYVVGAYTIYFLATDTRLGLQWAEDVYFGLLALLVILRMFRQRDAFPFTSLDALMLVLTIALATLGELNLGEHGLQLFKLLIWFYAVEVFALTRRRERLASGGFSVVFGLIVLRALTHA